MHWSNGILILLTLASSACASHPFYEREVQTAYDGTGTVRPSYATLNMAYLEAINEDLNACYAKKTP